MTTRLMAAVFHALMLWLSPVWVAANGVHDDLLDPGVPSIKSDYTEGFAFVQGAPDHFVYTAAEYHITEQTLHGTLVSVAIHHDAFTDASPAPEVFAQLIIDYFHRAWHVFGGYMYDRFGVKIRSPSEGTDFSLSAVGVSFPSWAFQIGNLDFLPHEIFHCWLGKAIRHRPSGRLFQLETWVTEGTTALYGHRLLGSVQSLAHYHNNLMAQRVAYQSNIGGPLDLSVEALAELGSADRTGPATSMLVHRSLWITYLLDRELAQYGVTMDDVLSALYVNYGLTDTTWTQADYERILEDLTGQNFQDFFDAYLYTNAVLPVPDAYVFPVHHWRELVEADWMVTVRKPAPGVWILHEFFGGRVMGHGADLLRGFFLMEGWMEHGEGTSRGELTLLDHGGARWDLASFDLSKSKNKTKKTRDAGAEGPHKLKLKSTKGVDGVLKATAVRLPQRTTPFVGVFASTANAIKERGKKPEALGAVAFSAHEGYENTSVLSGGGLSGIIMRSHAGKAYGSVQFGEHTWIMSGKLKDSARRVVLKTRGSSGQKVSLILKP